MRTVYNILLTILFWLSSPYFFWRMQRRGNWQAGFSQRFGHFDSKIKQSLSNRHVLWLHAVSVGEVNLLAPILERWERQHPDWEIVITTTTQAGYHLALKRYAPRLVCYCPLDFTWAVRRAMKRLRPDLLVLAELELWPNLIAAAKAHGAKVAVICSTDTKYEEQAEPLAAALKAAGARTVVLAGNPGANEARYRAAGVDRFIFIRCDVLGTLRDLLREEGALS